MKIKRFNEDFDNDVEVMDLEDVDISDAFTKKLVCWNDDVNTFDHVIECFVKILKHEVEQAEQCAWIIHTKGKCVVKNGSQSELKKYKDALTDAKLSVTIED